MAISVRKSLPSSARYSGSGDTTITLAGVSSITINTKKALIKSPIPQGKTTFNSNQTDLGKNYVIDLKKIDDTIKINGWVEDATATAWNKVWQLRAMCSSGGPLTSLVIEDLTFSSAAGSQQAYLEEVQLIVHPFRGKALNASAGTGVARIELELTFYLGDER